jgi:hypothetical protein
MKQEEANKNIKKMHAQMAVNFLFKTTESNSVNEFIERFFFIFFLNLFYL